MLYPIGGFLNSIKNTLIELVAKNFINIRKKKRNIKVSKRETKNSNRAASNSRFSMSSILINAAIKEKTEESKEEDAWTTSSTNFDGLEETTEKEPKDKKKPIVNGGYGTVKTYSGMASHVRYADYNKLWSHLGAFRTYDAYGNNESSDNIAMKNGESSREMVSTEIVEKAQSHFKYFTLGDVMGDMGFVPPVGSGVNSKDWEKYRLMSMMSVYQPLLKLKMSTA